MGKDMDVTKAIGWTTKRNIVVSLTEHWYLYLFEQVSFDLIEYINIVLRRLKRMQVYLSACYTQFCLRIFHQKKKNFNTVPFGSKIALTTYAFLRRLKIKIKSSSLIFLVIYHSLSRSQHETMVALCGRISHDSIAIYCGKFENRVYYIKRIQVYIFPQ